MADSAISPAWRYFQSAGGEHKIHYMVTILTTKPKICTFKKKKKKVYLLTVLQHLHDVLFNHG